MTAAFDTNVLIYAFDRRESKNMRARAVLSRANRRNTVLLDQTLLEFAHVLTRKLDVGLESATAAIQGFLELLPFAAAPADIVPRTLAVAARHKLSIWDARLIAACASAGVGVLVSEDMSDRHTYDGVRVLDPFNPVNDPDIDRLLA